jgi:hypothetical protein
MKLPRELTKVTPVSKAIAAVAFLTIPIMAFLWGMRFQKFEDINNVPLDRYNNQIHVPTPYTAPISPLPTPTPTKRALMRK